MPKQYLSCALLQKDYFAWDMFHLDFAWAGPPPKAGQFFMVKPKRTSVFLARPISVSGWDAKTGSLRFLIVQRGRGTVELTGMNPGEEAELTGPLGNAWSDFLPSGVGKIALAGGGAGIAPLLAFAGELGALSGSGKVPSSTFDLYAGFRTCRGPSLGLEQELSAISGLGEDRFILATEDGKAGKKGRVTDFLESGLYTAVFACGPEPMLQAAAAKCRQTGTPCFISLEQRMACGVGACLGCTVRTVQGNKRCCADGPVFPSEAVVFHD